MTLKDLLIQAVYTARALPEARSETVAESVLRDAGGVVPSDVAEAVRDMREFLGNEQAAYAVFEHMEAVVEFIEGLMAQNPQPPAGQAPAGVVVTEATATIAAEALRAVHARGLQEGNVSQGSLEAMLRAMGELVASLGGKGGAPGAAQES